MPMTSPIIENRIIENSPLGLCQTTTNNQTMPAQQPIHHQSYAEHWFQGLKKEIDNISYTLVI